MEFLKDYDCTILYHPGHANVVADALSRTVPAVMAGLMAQEWLLIEAFSLMTVSVVPKGSSILVAGLSVRLDLETEIREASGGDRRIRLWVDEQGQPNNSDFEMRNGILKFRGRVYVPNLRDLRQKIWTKPTELSILCTQEPRRCIQIFGKSIGGRG